MTQYRAHHLFYFKCKLCRKDKRQSVKEEVAKMGICRKCKKIDPRQAVLFDLKEYEKNERENRTY